MTAAAQTRAAPQARPANWSELRERMVQASASFTPRTRDAARHVLEHPHEVALQPLATVAGRSGIAASAFIRLAQALGFAGYGELQKICLTPLQEASTPSLRERIRHVGGEESIEHPADPVEVLRAFSLANQVSLEHLGASADSLPLGAALSMLREARLVHVVGLRRSFAVASYLAYALNRIGRPAIQINGLGGAIHEQARAIAAGDLLVAVSFPPYAEATVDVCEQASRQGARRLALTDDVLSPVALGADLTLQVHDAELMGFRSLTAALCLVQALTMALAFAQGEGPLAVGGGSPPEAWARPKLHDIDC